MEIRFKCKCCKEYHEIDRKIPAGYQGWCYTCMEWLAPDETMPPLSQERGWSRSETMPKIGETWKLRLQNPFHENVGGICYIDYASALQFFNGYDTAEEVDSSAIVQCRLERILEADDYAAWAEFTVLDVIPYRELASRFPAYETSEPLESFAGGQCKNTNLDAPPWKLVFWTAQGDVGESKYIFCDENGVRHLVLHLDECGWAEAMYFGNIVQK